MFFCFLYLFVWLVGLSGLLEEGREDAIGPLEGRKVVRSVQLAQRHRLRVDHQRVDLTKRNAETHTAVRWERNTSYYNPRVHELKRKTRAIYTPSQDQNDKTKRPTVTVIFLDELQKKTNCLQKYG